MPSTRLLFDNYRDALRQHSGLLMPFIEWQPDVRCNVDVLNDTADLYRFGDPRHRGAGMVMRDALAS
ncbi:hypothetical protein PA01_01135 [Azoarcus sp. PA01]|nr:hypothetical protein PA01_01135 [Azoarcus sp. PA01]